MQSCTRVTYSACISPVSANMPGTLPDITLLLRIRQVGFLTFGLLQGSQGVLWVLTRREEWDPGVRLLTLEPRPLPPTPAKLHHYFLKWKCAISFNDKFRGQAITISETALLTLSPMEITNTGLAKKFVRVFPSHVIKNSKRTFWPTRYFHIPLQFLQIPQNLVGLPLSQTQGINKKAHILENHNFSNI